MEIVFLVVFLAQFVWGNPIKCHHRSGLPPLLPSPHFHQSSNSDKLCYCKESPPNILKVMLVPNFFANSGINLGAGDIVKDALGRVLNGTNPKKALIADILKKNLEEQPKKVPSVYFHKPNSPKRTDGPISELTFAQIEKATTLLENGTDAEEVFIEDEDAPDSGEEDESIEVPFSCELPKLVLEFIKVNLSSLEEEHVCPADKENLPMKIVYPVFYPD